MKLTEHFYLAEIIESDYAERHGIKNLPSPAVLQNIQVLANALEHVRVLLGHPMTITSGYRSLELNRGIGGSKSSSHMTGFAADFKCYGFGTPKQIVAKLKASGIEYDECFNEGSWVHFSVDPRLRQKTFHVTFKNGKSIYSEA